jgi:hypothetical protein
MAFNIRHSVRNPETAAFQELYNRIDRLVNDAGHITILELFTKSAEEIGMRAWEAIHAAKEVGFLAMDNQRCCKNHECVESERGWCNQAESRQKCSAASDVCKR